MQTLSVIVIAVLILLVAIIAMAFKVLFVKGGKFPEGHAHDIAKLAEKRKDIKINNH